MTAFLLISSFVLVLASSFRSYTHPLGIWLFVLMTHGIFVHFGGESFRHYPMQLGFGVVALTLIKDRNFNKDLRPPAAFVLFLLILTLSFLLNRADGESATKLVAYIKPAGVFLFVAIIVRGVPALNILAHYVIAAAIAGSLFNIYQQIFGVQLTVNVWDPSLNRAAGLRGDPNDTAMLLLPAIPLIYYKLLNNSKGREKLLSVLLLITVVTGILLTGSRAGFIVLAVCAIALLLHRPHKFRPKLFGRPTFQNVLVLGVLSVTAIFLAPSYYWDRMATLTTGTEVAGSQSLYNRQHLLVEGFEIWLDNPLLGVGPGNFYEALYGSKLPSVVSSRPKAVAHNMYIEFLAEFGFFGLLIFLAICALSIMPLLRLDNVHSRFDSCTHIGYGWALGIGTMLAMGLTLSQGYNSVMWFALGIGASTNGWLPRALGQLRRSYDRT